MSEVRILTNDDLNQYITLISNDSHTYSWDKLYFQHVSPNYLKHILSKEEEYCNIFGNFKMKTCGWCYIATTQTSRHTT